MMWRTKMIASKNEFDVSKVEGVVSKHYGESIWQAIKAGIAVAASMSLQRRDNCLVLIYVGGSGQGKSITVRAFESDPPPTLDCFLRVDKFTPAAFVSHQMNKSEFELSQIDLLPQVKGKTMLTKELSPLFRGDQRVMIENFATLT